MHTLAEGAPLRKRLIGSPSDEIRLRKEACGRA